MDQTEAAPEAGRFGFMEAIEEMRHELAPREFLEVIIARHILGVHTSFIGRSVVTDPGDLSEWLVAAHDFHEAGWLSEAALAHFIEEALLVTLPEFYDDPEVRHLQGELNALDIALYNAPDRPQRRAIAARQAEVIARWSGLRAVIKVRVMRRLGEERYADLIESDPNQWWELVHAGAGEWTTGAPWNSKEPIPFEFDTDDEPAGVGRDAVPGEGRGASQDRLTRRETLDTAAALAPWQRDDALDDILAIVVPSKSSVARWVLAAAALRDRGVLSPNVLVFLAEVLSERLVNEMVQDDAESKRLAAEADAIRSECYIEETNGWDPAGAGPRHLNLVLDWLYRAHGVHADFLRRVGCEELAQMREQDDDVWTNAVNAGAAEWCGAEGTPDLEQPQDEAWDGADAASPAISDVYYPPVLGPPRRTELMDE